MVHVFPFQTQELAHTQPRRDGEDVEGLETVPIGCVQQSLGVLGGEGLLESRLKKAPTAEYAPSYGEQEIPERPYQRRMGSVGAVPSRLEDARKAQRLHSPREILDAVLIYVLKKSGFFMFSPVPSYSSENTGAIQARAGSWHRGGLSISLQLGGCSVPKTPLQILSGLTC